MVSLALVGLEFGLVVLVLVLLNARDRRCARASAAVLGACEIPRDCVALRIHASLWSRRTVAVLDVPPWAPIDVWPMMRRLVDGLPKGIEIVVDVRLDGLPTRVVPGRRTGRPRERPRLLRALARGRP